MTIQQSKQRRHPLDSTTRGNRMLLTKHEGATFQNQTIYISGQAFVRCTFIACTLVLRETVYYLEGCTFDRCNWHVDRVLMWGSPESIQEVKALIAMIESVQQQQQASAGQGNPPGTLVNPTPNFTGDPAAMPQPG
jgi:hypothetical protein